MREPTGVAVSQATGDVYVLDRKNNRVDVFSGECKFERAWGWGVIPQEGKPPKEELQVCTPVTGCQAGLSGEGVGQFVQPESLGGIAVDNSEPADASSGDVYVLNAGRVQKFDGEGHFLLQFPVGAQSVAVGPTGTVYVGESGAVQEYGPETGTPEPGGPIALAGAGGISDLAVNAKSEIYVSEGGIGEQNGETHPARHYSATGVPLGKVAECGGAPGEFDCENEGSARSLTATPTGEVYINQKIATGTSQIRGFSPAAIQVAAFATTNGEEGYGLAFDAQTGALYTPNNFNQVLVIVPPEPGPVISGESADGVEPTAAVVHAVIDPETNPEDTSNETRYVVEYGACASPGACAGTAYEHSVPSPEALLAPSFSEDEIPPLPLSGLSPRTKYHFRVLAANQCAKNPAKPEELSTCATEGENSTFETLPPALVEEEFSTDVRSTSATLHAVINPLGSASEYRFEYDTRPYAPGEGGHGVSLPVPDEQIGSGKTGVPVEQHVDGLAAGQVYHYRVVVTNALEKAPGEVQGEDRSFTTQTGGAAGLADNRAWELVSPPDKLGAQLFGANEYQFTQAAAGGDGIVYNASAPTEGQPQGNGEHLQVLASRGASGWSNLDLGVPHSFPAGVDPREPYRVFTSDLTSGVLQPEGNFEPALSKEATEQGPYLRDDTNNTFTPLVIGCRPGGGCLANRNDTTTPFMPFGEETTDEGECNELCGPEFQGATPDLSHIVLGAGINKHAAPLLQGTPAESLYEWAGGKLALVSQLPENPPEVNKEAPTLGGNSGKITAHAVSNDGSRVFWTHPAKSGSNLLFIRDMTRAETIEIGGGAAEFEGASAAGTLVFYSGKECEIPLTSALECKPVMGEHGEELEDGTVLASSEDGTWVYFRQGASIYVRHGDEAARLVASNIGNIRPTTVEGTVPQQDPWRASPDGEWFAFMSDSPLTAYDNHDAVTGQPDEEVYLYSAAAGRLVCASCDPTGARPHGRLGVNLNLADYAGIVDSYQSVAASVPGATPYAAGHALYDPRFLSDSGRLFFNAVGGLVPRDVNGQVDTYEREPSGVGGCTTATQTGSVVYSPAAAGCVALISNGESSEESVFADASESGDDVFFLSSSRLSTADLDGSLSMWDAHVCTTSPCIQPPATPSPSCNTESSCKPSQSPQPEIFGAGASETFNGPGNATPSLPPKGKTAAQVRAAKLKAALRACKKKRNRHRRTVCEMHARKTYGAAAKAKRATHHGRAGQ